MTFEEKVAAVVLPGLIWLSWGDLAAWARVYTLAAYAVFVTVCLVVPERQR